MNRKIVIIVSVLLVAIGGSMTYLLTTSSDNNSKKESVSQTSANPEISSPSAEKSDTTTQPGTYKDYSETIVSETKGTKLLFFHAPWCPQCRDIESDIKNKGVPSGVTIIKVDYDTNQTLKQKYGVTLQTTIVKIDDSGNLVDKFVAYDNPSLSAIVEKLL